jgi:hypothetical protein
MGRWTLRNGRAYKIQLHDTEWIVSLLADWDQSHPPSPPKKVIFFYNQTCLNNHPWTMTTFQQWPDWSINDQPESFCLSVSLSLCLSFLLSVFLFLSLCLSVKMVKFNYMENGSMVAGILLLLKESNIIFSCFCCCLCNVKVSFST